MSDVFEGFRILTSFCTRPVDAGFFLFGGRYWDRTSGFHRVKVALYR